MQSVFSDLNSMVEQAQKLISELEEKMDAVNSKINNTTLTRDKIQNTLDLLEHQKTFSYNQAEEKQTQIKELTLKGELNLQF